jgi:hypothetical protein
MYYRQFANINPLFIKFKSGKIFLLPATLTTASAGDVIILSKNEVSAFTSGW